MQQEGHIYRDFVTELKRLSFECELDNLQYSLIKDMIVYGTRDNSICERFPGKCDLTLSKAISSAMLLRKLVGMTARFSDLNLPSTSIRFLKGISKSQIITVPTRKRRNLQKKFNFWNSSHHWSKCPAYGKVCYVFNKKTTVCCQCVHKKVHEIVRSESGEPSDQSHYEFFI